MPNTSCSKGEPLCWLEGLQHHEERETDRVGEHGVGLRMVGASDHRSRHVHGMLIEGASRRDVRVRDMSTHTRATTVVSQTPATFTG
jgi:hypothetical protein